MHILTKSYKILHNKSYYQASYQILHDSNTADKKDFFCV